MTFLFLLNYAASLFMVFFGIYAMTAAHHLIRKVLGMVIMQSGVILFFVSLAYKKGASIPILPYAAKYAAVSSDGFANPLPHALMLTAIVVGVSLLGVALALCLMIYREHDTLEEPEIVKNLESPQ